MNKQELKEELIRLENQYSAMLIMEMKIKIAIDELNREKRIISKQLQEIENEEFVTKKLEELKKDFSDGYCIYKYELGAGFCGSDEIGYFVCSKDYNYEQDLDEMAYQNLQSYGYITEEDLGYIMEEEGYDEEETALEELELEIGYPDWGAEKVEEEDITLEILEQLQDF